ncbi:hypothetical protein Pint_30161 [Pistacia integerrima]|uniref:Uncharacterized protein n=1 Tax=Pistacia integerrima TaxID=434235 RepID=A0ACC0WZL5_9ROSI|nr:hypothetical protein Pint_30161 [Pistacia integerrima]
MLFDGYEEKNENVLKWEGRLRIATQIKTRTRVSNSGCRRPIVHRDVKSTNILLNEKFQRNYPILAFP